MKVTTDACLFGALVAEKIRKSTFKINTVLDIGTGTGLLSLMLAQKTNAKIDAVEIDQAAAEQARQNFLSSSWKERLTVLQGDVLEFVPSEQYDLVISNPPFYESDLRSPDKRKNSAKHDDTLTMAELITFAEKQLSDEGWLALLIPFHRTGEVIELAAESGLYPISITTAFQTPRHQAFRSILIFSRNKRPVKETDLLIKDETGDYSERFKELLGDYYLKEL